MSDFNLNLKLAMNRRKLTVKQLADALTIHSTAISRLRNNSRSPNVGHIDRIEKYFGFDEGVMIYEHEKFCAYIDSNKSQSNLVLNKIRSIEQNKKRWIATSAKYTGDYLVYYKQSPKGDFICSFMHIGNICDEGIEMMFINPHIDASRNKTYYRYKGFMYPLSGFIYCFLEQSDNDYEIFSVILLDSAAPRPSTILGMISGIQANFEDSSIAARPVVIQRCANPVRNWQESHIMKKLTYLKEGDLPEIVRNKISSESITIKPLIGLPDRLKVAEIP